MSSQEQTNLRSVGVGFYTQRQLQKPIGRNSGATASFKSVHGAHLRVSSTHASISTLTLCIYERMIYYHGTAWCPNVFSLLVNPGT